MRIFFELESTKLYFQESLRNSKNKSEHFKPENTLLDRNLLSCVSTFGSNQEHNN